MRIPLSTRQHVYGTITATIYHEGLDESLDGRGAKFAYDLRPEAILGNPRWVSTAETEIDAQVLADERLRAEFERRGEDHVCTPGQCGEWTSLES